MLVPLARELSIRASIHARRSQGVPRACTLTAIGPLDELRDKCRFCTGHRSAVALLVLPEVFGTGPDSIATGRGDELISEHADLHARPDFLHCIRDRGTGGARRWLSARVAPGLGCSRGLLSPLCLYPGRTSAVATSAGARSDWPF